MAVSMACSCLFVSLVSGRLCDYPNVSSSPDTSSKLRVAGRFQPGAPQGILSMRWLLDPLRLAILALGLALLYTLVGFFLVPYLIKAYAIPAVAEKLKRPVLVKEVELNPFALSLRLTGFEIRETDQSALLGFDEFFINLQASSLIRRAYVFDTIRLTVPYVSARVFKDGRMNLAELVPPDDGSQPAASPQAEKTPAEIPAVEIGEFEIAQGIVEFRDESKPKPYLLDIVPIRIVLKNFHTKPGGDNSYAFTAELGKDETLSWAGTVSLEPIQSSGKFSLSGVKLHNLWQYLHDRFRFDVIDGTVAADARYAFDVSATPISFKFHTRMSRSKDSRSGRTGASTRRS